MSTFAGNLPDDLLEMLSNKANELDVPQNKLVEKALRIYLEQINRAEYVRSYKRASNDQNILDLAEEGMEEYLKQIEE